MASMGDDFITWFGHWTKMSPEYHALTTGGHRSGFVRQVFCVLMRPTDAFWMLIVACTKLDNCLMSL